jgi:hypothetical protein
MLFEPDEYAVLLCIDIVTSTHTHAKKRSTDDISFASYDRDEENIGDIGYQLTSLHSTLALFKLFNLWKRFPNVIIPFLKCTKIIFCRKHP